MASVFNQFDPNQQDPNQQGQGSQAPTQLSSGEGASVGSGSSASPSGASSSSSNNPNAQSSGQGTHSGSFTNLNKYMNANKDFGGQGGFAGQFSGNINNQAQNTQNTVNEAGNAFKQQNQQATNAFTNPDLVNQAFQDPTKFTQDQNNVNQFAQIRDAQYKGPKDLSDMQGGQNYFKLQSDVQNVNNMANQAQNENGRYALLQQMYGNSHYGQGQKALDNMFLQNGAGTNQIKGLRQTAFKTQDQLNQTQDQASQMAQASTKQAADTRADVANRLGTANTNFQNQINDEVTQMAKSRDDAYTAALTRAKAGQMTGDDAELLGLKGGQKLYGVNLNDYLTKGNVAVNANNVANQNEFDLSKALATLSNGASLLDPTQKQALDNAYGFNKDSLASALKDRENKYNQYIAPNEGGYNIYNTAQDQLNAYNNYMGQLTNYNNQRNSIQSQMNDVLQHSGAQLDDNGGFRRDDNGGLLAQEGANIADVQKAYDQYQALQNQYNTLQGPASAPLTRGGVYGLLNAAGMGGDETVHHWIDEDGQHGMATALQDIMTNMNSAHDIYTQGQKDYGGTLNILGPQALDNTGAPPTLPGIQNLIKQGMNT